MEIGNNISKEFDAFATNYTNDMINCVPHYLRLIASFAESLPKDFAPKNILDLGCGNGNVTSTLLQLYPNSRFTLLDASPEMINKCKERFKGYNVDYCESFFNDYSFTANHFDIIVAGFSLHHCPANEKKLLFQRINKSLKKGGIFGCSDLMINKNNPDHPQLLKAWKTFVLKNYPDGEKWNWLMEHYSEFDRPDHYSDQIKWLKEAGFNLIEIITQQSYWIHIRAIKT